MVSVKLGWLTQRSGLAGNSNLHRSDDTCRAFVLLLYRFVEMHFDSVTIFDRRGGRGLINDSHCFVGIPSAKTGERATPKREIVLET